MSRTVTRLFDSRMEAEGAVRALEAAGFDHAKLSLVAADRGDVSGENRSFLNKDAAQDLGRDGENDTAEGAGEGAVTGGAIGAGAGLLAGLGLLAIPGLGPVVAAGWLASTLTGAAIGAATGGVTGGLLGALKDAGVTDDDANVYAEGVRRGGALVSVRVSDEDALRAEDILDEARGVDAMTRGSQYRQEGWSRFEPSKDDTGYTSTGGVI